MSVFQTFLNSGKLYSFRKPLNLLYSRCKCLFTRKFSDVPRKFKTFDEVVAQRRVEAKRSIVVQVNSEASFKELYGYCSKYASINGIHHYKTSIGENFMLIEFNSEESLKDVLRMCSTHQKDPDVMGIQSPFLWFRASSEKNEKFQIPEEVDLVTRNAMMSVNEDDLYESLMNCQSICDQILTLYEKTALNDLGIRLRYMVARQIESMLDSLYANIAVLPFGSSVNGFGKLGCDLDLVLTNNLNGDMAGRAGKAGQARRLVFQEKREEGGRAARQLELAGAALELRAPGTARLQRILHARVPILKCRHHLADLDCDLCYNNMSGVHMSALLWALGELDERVRPLVFVVRRWAETVSLTNKYPGRWITNFPLTLMVLFFLQQKSKDGIILPTVNTLVKLADKEDIRIAEDNIKCSFLRDLNKLPSEQYSQNQTDIGSLLLQFFEFYAQFDFREKALSINSGEIIRKPSSLPLYIVNPLETVVNVSRNVSFEECERLKVEVRNAAWQLEENPIRGLTPLIQNNASRALNNLVKAGNSHRLISVKDLFDDEESPKKPETVTKPPENVKKQPLKFKNSQIANEVYRIRRNKIV